jgi:uncharacterized membrane protein YhaH (DUF805 family)
MSWLQVLASPAGRIDRKTYNIAAIAPLVLAIVAVILVGFSAFGMKLESSITDPATGAITHHYRWGVVGPAGLSGWFMLAAGVIATAMSFWSSLALCAKRLHDRDKSAWSMSPWFLAAAIVLVPNMLFALPFGVRMTALVVAIAVVLWHTYELSFKHGTPGDNRFGPPAHAATAQA